MIAGSISHNMQTGLMNTSQSDTKKCVPKGLIFFRYKFGVVYCLCHDMAPEL